MMAGNKYRIDYKLFKEANPNFKGSALLYSKIWHTYISKIFNRILEGKFVRTPIGTLRIIKKKVNTKNIAVNWKESKKERTTIYHFNEHSGGYKVQPRLSRVKNLQKYTCVFVRKINRDIAKHITEDKDNYKKYETNLPKFSNL